MNQVPWPDFRHHFLSPLRPEGINVLENCPGSFDGLVSSSRGGLDISQSNPALPALAIFAELRACAFLLQRRLSAQQSDEMGLSNAEVNEREVLPTAHIAR
ncbi:MAG: hypothetical protein WAL32_19020 [Terriglobales bacterium]